MAIATRHGVIAVSHRLRMVQRDFADQDERQQREYLGEELERILKEIPFDERRTFLQLLLEQFPEREGQTLSAGPVPPASVTHLTLDQPMQLVDALVDGLGSLPDDQRTAVASRLRRVLAEFQQPGETSAQSATIARSTFQLPAEAEIHENRFGELANLLAEYVIKMEQLTVAVWGKVAGKSSLRPPKHAKRLAGQFLSEERGDPEGLIEDLQSLVQFATAIMTATSRAGEAVAGRYWRQLSPEAIRTVVDMEQNRLRDTLLGRSACCWRKYCELMAALGPEHIEKELESAMADHAEGFVRGLERLT